MCTSVCKLTRVCTSDCDRVQEGVNVRKHGQARAFTALHNTLQMCTSTGRCAQMCGWVCVRVPTRAQACPSVQPAPQASLCLNDHMRMCTSVPTHGCECASASKQAGAGSGASECAQAHGTVHGCACVCTGWGVTSGGVGGVSGGLWGSSGAGVTLAVVSPPHHPPALVSPQLRCLPLALVSPCAQPFPTPGVPHSHRSGAPIPVTAPHGPWPTQGAAVLCWCHAGLYRCHVRLYWCHARTTPVPSWAAPVPC